MKVSEQWLREWVNPDTDSSALEDLLTMGGLEVDGSEPCADRLEGVIVGQVISVQPHPDADRLSLCQVDIGAAESLQIVCGASNVRAGSLYPVATAGTVLPGGMRIKRSKLRGQVSQGMLCSATELGLAEVGEGILELPPGSLVGAALDQILMLDDRIIDINITPNRADCFSIQGLARDVAALTGMPFSPADVPLVPPVSQDLPDMRLQAPAGCPVLGGRILTRLNPAALTPVWLAERLRRSGIRAVHPVVDICNYVMIELGQPMHAYDRDLLHGDMLSARYAVSGECLDALDGSQLELDNDALVITDNKRVVALAGIMGGAVTAVNTATTSVLLESAYFAPQAIAGRARRYGLHTDSALRFERGVDFGGQRRALERATALILEVCGGVPGPIVLEQSEAHLPVRQPVVLRIEKLKSLLGIDLPRDNVTGILERLGFDVAVTHDGWQVLPPPARFDITIEADLIEEVARVYGYDRVPEQRESAHLRLGELTETRVQPLRVSTQLAARGYQEAVNYSFVDTELQNSVLGSAPDLALSNPLSVDLAVMRRSLWPGLLQTWSLNSKRQQERVRLFESGVIFELQDNDIKEISIFAGLASGAPCPPDWSAPETADRRTDLFDIKADVESVLRLTGAADEFSWHAADHPALRPGRSARLDRNGEPAGWLGELHPRLVKHFDCGPAPVLFELQALPTFAAHVPVYKPVSRFPSVRRDLAIVVPEALSVAELIAEVRSAAGQRLVDIVVFDVYRGNKIESGLKSVALGLILQETSRTLTESEIDRTVAAVIERISGMFNASIRE